MKTVNMNSLSYQRSGEISVTIENFTPQSCDIDELAIYGIPLIRDKMQDFCFDTADLDTFSDPMPKQGDKIVWNGLTFSPFLIGEQVFKFPTSSRKRIRVHARQIG